jgi:hypothetical protein
MLRPAAHARACAAESTDRKVGGSEASATCPPVTRRGSAVGDQVDLDWLDAAQQAEAACQVQSGVE